ncbi:hypothetical protein [Aquimarina sp. Aq78]|uniref:hypothetical protein n=1 Tax=Aquimarina sp. Aq78 TaxID=1191889 RepID=UPI000D0FEA53|nr:hypothetical protein [Aquimarina sp. Aq78]
MKLNKLFPLLYLLIWGCILFGLPKEVFYSGEGIMRWIVFGGIFFILPYVLFKSLELTSLAKKTRSGIAIASVFLGIPFGLWLGIQSKAELKSNGNTTIGIIKKAWMVKRRNQADVWSVQAYYNVNNKPYKTSTKENPEKSLSKGDTVTILYSKTTPQMSEILELEK